MSRVVVALSGGVDSSVATLLTKLHYGSSEALYMKNWEGELDGGECPQVVDYQDAQSVCKFLDVKLHLYNFSHEYYQLVFEEMLRTLKMGLTPNPDILCNKYIKFGVCLEAVKRLLGASRIATGHYARVGQLMGRPTLMVAEDREKDQTYFLHALSSDQISYVEFPLGNFTKGMVRRLASSVGLHNYSKKDSTGICFIGSKSFQSFIQQYICLDGGAIKDDRGEIIGEHKGLHLYTIGQRKGVGIGGLHQYSPEPWYVSRKDMLSNTLHVTQDRSSPYLWRRIFSVAKPEGPFSIEEISSFKDLKVKIRHQGKLFQCRLVCEERKSEVISEEPIWAISPGQSAVFYSGPFCLGGAIISC